MPGAVFTLQVPSGHDWHGKTLELIELKWFNSHAVGFFKGVPDRTAAEALVKAILWIDQDADEQSAEEDAWFDHQLVGLDVVRDGEKIGVVRQVNHMPAQDLLVVEIDSKEVLVPFVKAIVPSVDIVAGTMTITPPPGLLEDLPESDDDEREPAEADASDDASAGEASAEEADSQK
ncbi:Ribosome maturation factor RimM [Agreia sp. COWG]|nr:Ribosome maturation factor RimM [Agreia sp. COWG]